MTSRPAGTLLDALPAALLVACAIAAWPVAWAIVRVGYGLRAEEPVRDIALLLVVSAAEEIVFRGGVQAALLRWRPHLANVATSVLFAAAHLWNHPPLAAAAVFPISLLLGWVYERGGKRLAPPIALHAYFNLTLYACTWLAAQ